MNLQPVCKLNKTEYLEYEDAIAADARGRAFLRQRDAKAQMIAAERVAVLLRRAIGPRPALERESDQVHVLRRELNEISGYIQQTRQEIASLRPDRPGNSSINSATGELDAIVSQTEEATYSILNGAERIQQVAAQIPTSDDVAALASQIENQAIEIMTTCSFQDLTGQRMTRVVNALRFIERRVNTMIEIWGVDGSIPPVVEPADTRPDAHLMNGPQTGGEAVSQNDIDALFSMDGEAASAPVDQDAIDKLFA